MQNISHGSFLEPKNGNVPATTAFTIAVKNTTQGSDSLCNCGSSDQRLALYELAAVGHNRATLPSCGWVCDQSLHGLTQDRDSPKHSCLPHKCLQVSMAAA